MSGVGELRKRRERRRRILRWVPSVVISAGIIVLVAVTLAFNGSWWRQANPVASAQQQYDNQSLFTQAGIDFAAKQQLVKISLAENRAAATRLGLRSSGARGVAYIVPLTLDISAGAGSFRQTLVDHVRVLTSSGRVSAVELTYDQPYPQEYQIALHLVSTMGNASGEQDFEAALASSRNASRDQRYEAKSVGTYAGMRMQVELVGTSGTSNLEVSLRPAGS